MCNRIFLESETICMREPTSMTVLIHRCTYMQTCTHICSHVQACLLPTGGNGLEVVFTRRFLLAWSPAKRELPHAAPAFC